MGSTAPAYGARSADLICRVCVALKLMTLVAAPESLLVVEDGTPNRGHLAPD